MMNNEGEEAEGMKRGIMVEHRKRRGWDEQFRRDLRGTELLLLLLAPVTARRLDPCLAADHEKWAGCQSLSSMKKISTFKRGHEKRVFFSGGGQILTCGFAIGIGAAAAPHRDAGLDCGSRLPHGASTKCLSCLLLQAPWPKIFLNRT